MPEVFEFRTGEIPAKPGVYIYRDRFGTVIYVGKAANLRKRMSSYFQASRQKLADSKLRSLINSIHFWEYHVVRTEDEALILESRLIKEYMPRYNILMRDDKRYQLIRIDTHAPMPKLEVCRIQRHDGARYFGPFPNGTALKETVTFLTRYFKLRGCKTENPDAETYKHCLAGTIRDCSRPCIGKVSNAEYQAQIAALIDAIDGSISPLCAAVEAEMKNAAENKNFEAAARLRDVMVNLQTVFGQKSRNFRYAKIPVHTGEEAMLDLRDALRLSALPKMIEGFDNSHTSGYLPVSSMVCFIDGKACPARYRRFKLRDAVEGYPDDYAAMTEVLTRHFTRKIAENLPMPDLVLIDGGIGQLHIATKVFESLQLQHIPLAGLAERQEEIYVPWQTDPIVLERHRPALRLLQSVRDEAHRFAVTYNRELRNKKLQESLLDKIEGIGDIRKKQILIAFGSVRALRKADSEEICKRVPGIGVQLAEKILRHVKGTRPVRPIIINQEDTDGNI